MKAAGAAASSPSTRGSVKARAPRAPTRVARFHSMNTEAPVAQNASRAERESVRRTAIAEDSSMTRCAASSLTGPRGRRIAVRLRP